MKVFAMSLQCAMFKNLIVFIFNTNGCVTRLHLIYSLLFGPWCPPFVTHAVKYPGVGNWVEQRFASPAVEGRESGYLGTHWIARFRSIAPGKLYYKMYLFFPVKGWDDTSWYSSISISDGLPFLRDRFSKCYNLLQHLEYFIFSKCHCLIAFFFFAVRQDRQGMWPWVTTVPFRPCTWT